MAPDEDTAGGTGAGADDGAPLPPGLEQFQHAALEAVKAARAMLDAAESAIRDPAALETVVRTAAGIARTATESVAGFAAGAMRDAAGPAPGRPRAEPDDDEPGGYHDISVD